jgi:hypothetical protein
VLLPLLKYYDQEEYSWHMSQPRLSYLPLQRHLRKMVALPNLRVLKLSFEVGIMKGLQYVLNSE